MFGCKAASGRAGDFEYFTGAISQFARGHYLGSRKYRYGSHGHTVGAYDYIEKPFKSDKLWSRWRVRLKQRACKRKCRVETPRQCSTGIGGQGLGDGAIKHQNRQAVANQKPRHDFGPSGSGKEAAAHQLHARSPRATGNFISVHTAMLGDDAEQIDRTLFGCEVGGQIDRAFLSRPMAAPSISMRYAVFRFRSKKRY